MKADESRPVVRRPRKVTRAVLPPGPVRQLRDVIYELYVRADYPQLARLVAAMAADDDLDASPGKDVISRVIGAGGPASRQDTVTVAIVLARVAGDDEAVIEAQVRPLWLAAHTSPEPDEPLRLGRPIADCDPLALEVHSAIDVPGQHPPDSGLPRYVVRSHDARLRRAADLGMAGESRMLTVVGGSSTGKTRACWELVRYLEARQPGRWWVWHPYDPTRPEAAAQALAGVGPYTVVWLNEAQEYLAPADPGLGERITAGLRSLLHDRARGPVLVLATMWPDYWTRLTTRPDAGDLDPYGQARQLLTGTAVIVTETFTPAELAALTGPDADSRMREAAARAEDGRITQYLAGAPELVTRYRTAGPAVRAIIQVAIDARRLGHPLGLPHTLLAQAAPGYMNDYDWDSLGEDWLEQALAYATQSCKGVRGPLTRIRPRPDNPGAAGEQPHYRLADYLEQTGRAERVGLYPPESLWIALANALSDPHLLVHLGQQAEARGRYQHAIWLYSRAADRGNSHALGLLIWRRHKAGDFAGAEALRRQAVDRYGKDSFWMLSWWTEQAGDGAGAAAVPREPGAEHVNTFELARLAMLQKEAGDTVGADALLLQAIDCGDPRALVMLAVLREEAGDTVEADRIWSFGLTASGKIATGLDFDS